MGIKELWKTRRVLFIIAAVLAVLLLTLLIFAAFSGQDFAVAVGRSVGVVALVAVAIAVFIAGWLGIDWVAKRAKRRRQEELDARIAAREGVEERKREWARWMTEMRQQKIDRYSLPFYLLVGEPQSGKSVMLHNSGMHFPFGQSKLSGPGGTRGCDWWFTEEAVILDLAGRLFTHEGGASDAAEWDAFLKLLTDFRPATPANGIILVIPCDSLLQDESDVRAKKAASIKDALLTLVNRLEAQFPVYLVLTKADKVFGFAESVHRLDADKRQEMFGWSRPAEGFDKPFSLDEVRAGFDGLVRRTHVLRAHALSEARIPDALPEVDRLFAFPDELRAARPAFEDYVKRIFSDSILVDRLFFRGVYLCCGLQKGAPITKACSELLGGASEADRRDLEGLFSKQRAYFIHDLIRKRVFAERGLVRPTSARVKRSLRVSLWGYGAAAGLALLTAGWYASYPLSDKREKTKVPEYDAAVEAADTYFEKSEDSRSFPEFLAVLDSINGAVKADLSQQQLFKGMGNCQDDFRTLYTKAFGELQVRARAQAADAMQRATQARPATAADFLDLVILTKLILKPVDLKSDADLGRVAAALGQGVAPGGESGSFDLLSAVKAYREYAQDEAQPTLDFRSQELIDAAAEVPGYFDAFASGDIAQDIESTKVGELGKVIELSRLERLVLEKRQALIRVHSELTSGSGIQKAADLAARYAAAFDALDESEKALHAGVVAMSAQLSRTWVDRQYDDLEAWRQEILAATNTSMPPSGGFGWSELKDAKDELTGRGTAPQGLVTWENAKGGEFIKALPYSSPNSDSAVPFALAAGVAKAATMAPAAAKPLVKEGIAQLAADDPVVGKLAAHSTWEKRGQDEPKPSQDESIRVRQDAELLGELLASKALRALDAGGMKASDMSADCRAYMGLEDAAGLFPSARENLVEPGLRQIVTTARDVGGTKPLDLEDKPLADGLLMLLRDEKLPKLRKQEDKSAIFEHCLGYIDAFKEALTIELGIGYDRVLGEYVRKNEDLLTSVLFKPGVDVDWSKYVEDPRCVEQLDKLLRTDLREIQRSYDSEVWDAIQDKSRRGNFLSQLRQFLYSEKDLSLKSQKIDFTLTPDDRDGDESTAWTKFNFWWPDSEKAKDFKSRAWSAFTSKWVIDEPRRLSMAWGNDETQGGDERVKIGKSAFMPLILAWHLGRPESSSGTNEKGYTTWTISKLGDGDPTMPFMLTLDRPLPELVDLLED